MTAAVALEGVFQHIGGRCALADIDLRLEPGEWLLVIGPNGAGKTLLTRLLLGLDRPSAGRVRLAGEDLGTLDAAALRRLRQRLGAVLQGGSLLEELTVLENLLLPLRAAPLSRDERARAARLALTRLQLDGLENHWPRSLSLGQRRRVELARALIHRPALVIWDGLTDGLDPGAASDTLALLAVERDSQRLTLVATDNRAAALSDYTERVAVLDRGRLLFDGRQSDLAAAAAEDLALRYLLRAEP
ncbi:ABC transporter ATP-binding protein [Thiococcus pfennigii]|uniref:ATP-binding cassette domain-containing protein n=1 Tax=Thiococcus pfennigii TaxID=1057 RepID=UPI0019065E50|nr:ABC transporter ATP-binding protein [Thiococcus pfennigii]MBK1731779.1 ABC transporter [Thiococcus pfennigii]